MASPAIAAPDERTPTAASIRKTIRKSISRRRTEELPPPVPDLPPTLTLPLDIDPSSPPQSPSQAAPVLSPTSAANPRRTKQSSKATVSTARSSISIANGLPAPASGSAASPAAALALTASASFAETDRKYAARQAVDAITNVRLSPHHANLLLTLCAAEIRARGLETPGIFRPLRLAESHKELDALIRLFLLVIDSERFAPLFDRNGGATAAQSYAANAAASAIAAIAPVGSGVSIGLAAGSCLNPPEALATSLAGITTSASSSASYPDPLPTKQSDLLTLFDEKLDAQSAYSRLQERLQYASILDVVALFKWGLRHVKITPADFGITQPGADAYSWYEKFKTDESRANYPLDAYTKFLIPKLQPQMSALLATVFEVMSSVAAHHLSNFMPACTIIRVLGYWLLGRVGSDHPPPNFTSILTHWTRANTMTEHLFLAYIRDQIAHSLYELPLRLTELVDGYPNLTHFSDADAGANEEFLSDVERVSRTTPQLPPALRSRRVAAIKATLRSENIVVSLKRPRTPSDTLSAALGAETCDAEEDELVAWDVIQSAAARAVGREREGSNGGSIGAAHRMSMSQSHVSMSSPVGNGIPGANGTENGHDRGSPEAASAAAAADSRLRKREADGKREAAVLDEESARVFGLVAGAIAVRRAVIEAIDPREAAAAAAAANAGQQPQRSLASPTYGSVYSRFGSRNGAAGGGGGSFFGRSTSEFGHSPSSRASLSHGPLGSPRQPSVGTGRPSMTQSDSQHELRKSTSFSGQPTTHTRESSLTPLPEDVDQENKASTPPSGASQQANGGAAAASDWANFASSGFGASTADAELTLTSPRPFASSTTDEPQEMLLSTPPPSSSFRPRRASSSFSSMRRSSRRALLSAAAINGEYGSPHGAEGGGGLSSPYLSAPPPPGPTHRLLALETIEVDETLAAAWQDQLLDFALCAHFPPLVLAQLHEGVGASVQAALRDDARSPGWILVDETVIPPRPPLPASGGGGARSDSASVSDKRSLFAPSIRSLTASIRRLRSVGNFLTKRAAGRVGLGGGGTGSGAGGVEKSSADAMMESYD